ncbi:DnaJ domain-containing protein [Desulforamulus aquiferis]|uniref:DnaJ domain-containing protein n=1 Tax=Desulforamulus aquiferis TaxID=1397668 RepID=A0AAW7ZHT9_9FIRM|nr:DnaJ domain-containing protein [Desulforamulus aquiferis]MDO7788928.1 DnaJ domain-containing protein [Desulforamulus aquiferis]
MIGLERTGGEGEIKAAYRRLARKHHLDLHTGSQKEAEEEKFKEINEVYEVLSDPEKRAKYDNFGIKWQNGQTPDMGNVGHYNNYSDIFAAFFGGGTEGHRVNLPGQDIEGILQLTVEEAYRGGNKTIQLLNKVLEVGCAGRK